MLCFSPLTVGIQVFILKRGGPQNAEAHGPGPSGPSINPALMAREDEAVADPRGLWPSPIQIQTTANIMKKGEFFGERSGLTPSPL